MSEVEDLLNQMTAQDKGWATERTAKDILNALDNRSKNNATSEKQEEKVRKERDSAFKDLKKSANALGGKGSKTINMFENVSEKAGNVKTAFSSLETGSIAALAISFTAAAIIVDQFTEYLSTSVSVMNDFYNTGITFAGGMADMRMSAALASISMDEFAKIMVDRSAVFTKMGSRGVRDFGNMSMQVRNSLQGLGQLGMKTEELNDYLGEYLEQQRLAQTLDTLSRSQQASAATEYMKSLDMWSVALGKSRKELEESSKSMVDSTQVQAALRSMPEDIRQTVMDNLKRAGPAFNALGPEFGQMLEEMVATGGRPMSEFGKRFIAASGPLSGQILELVNKMRTGTVTNAEFSNEINEMKSNVGPVADQLSKLVAQLGDTDPAFSSLISSLLGLERSASLVGKPMDPFQAVLHDLGEAGKDLMGSFSSIAAALLGSDGLQSALSSLTEFIRDPLIIMMKGFADWLKKNNEILAPIAVTLGSFLGILTVLTAMKTAIVGISAAFSLITGSGLAVGAGLAGIGAALAPVLIPIAAVALGLTAVGTGLYLLWDNFDFITEKLGDFGDFISGLVDRLSNFFTNFFSILEAINPFDGMMDGVKDMLGFASGGMGDFGSGTPTMLHGHEAIIPTVGKKVPVDVTVKHDPIKFNKEFQSGTGNSSEQLAVLLKESNNLAKELIEVGKHQINETGRNSKDLGNQIRSGLQGLEGSFAA